MGTFTDNLNLYKPANGELGWGDEVDANFDVLDIANVTRNARYCGPFGDDANNGLTLATAKQTVMAAYDSIVGNWGAIYCVAGPANEPVEIGKPGIWLGGGNDANVASFGVGGDGDAPYENWRAERSILVKGIGFNASGIAGPEGGPQVELISTPANDDGPMLWCSGTAQPMRFENICFGRNYSRPNWNIRLGISSHNMGIYTNTSQITFKNCSGFVQSNTAAGPNVDIGYVFWIGFEDCYFAANENWYLEPTRDQGQYGKNVFGIRRSTVAGEQPIGVSGGLITIDRCTTSAAGIYYDVGGFGWQIVVRDFLVEGYGPDLPPAVELTGVNGFGTAYLESVSVADAGVEPAAILINGGLAGANPDSVLISGNGWGSIWGPCTILGQKPSTRHAQAHSPSYYGQRGFISGRAVGQHDSARRSFAPSVARYANIISQDPTAWVAGGSATWTTGVRAPDGSTNAATLSPNGANYDRQAFRANVTFESYDWLILGVWMRFVNVSSEPVASQVLLGVGGGTTFFPDGNTSVAGALPYIGNEEWQWCTVAGQILDHVDPTDTFVQFQCSTQADVSFFAPVLYHVSQGWLTDDEVQEFILHLQNVPDGCPIGAISSLRGQKIIARGGLGVGNSASATTPGSVVKKVQVFDETGTSLGYVPVYDAIT